MISKKELGYVNNYAKYAPFPGINYAVSVMEELSRTYKLYNDIYKDKDHNLIFSNGEEIEYTILSRNIAHLLGIDFKNLVSDPMMPTIEKVLGFTMYDRKNSYDMLTRIIERADEVIKNDSNPNNYKILNYYKSMIKCAIFCQFSSFDKFNFGCINFDREVYQQQFENNFLPQSTKYFFAQSNEALTPYFMMGIKYDNEVNKYVPETLLAPLDYANFFINQELIIPTQILTSDNNNLIKKIASNEDKLSLLNMYKFIINTYKTNSYINIFNDYQNMLMSNNIEFSKVKNK